MEEKNKKIKKQKNIHTQKTIQKKLFNKKDKEKKQIK